MPWTAADADKHKKGLSDKGRRQWAHVANSAMKKCMEEGGEDCEQHAIMQANGATGSDEKETQELATKSYVPYGVSSWEDLDKARAAQEQVQEMYETTSDFIGLVQSAVSDPMVEDKPGAIEKIASGFKSRLSKKKEISSINPSLTDTVRQAVSDTLTALLGKHKETAGDVMIWKDNGRYYWIARYSNNIRDDDRPQEIISEASHRRFVEQVDKGLAPLPVVEIWHRPELKFGQATWVAYDDTGFALAAGTVDKDKEDVALWLMQQKDIRTSHGMPLSTIRRDPQDPTVITEHETREISVLPAHAAANKLTGFVFFGDQDKEADEMTIPANKKEALVKEWGADPALLDRLEELNARDAEKAQAEGRDTKESTTEAETVAAKTETEQAAPPEVPAPEEKSQNDAPGEEDGTETVPVPVPYVTREEVAEALVPFAEQMKQIAEAVAALTKEITALKEKPAEAPDPAAPIVRSVNDVPVASLSAVLAQRLSAIGEPNKPVAKTSTLARSKPKEAPAEPAGRTGIPMIDGMLSASGPQD